MPCNHCGQRLFNEMERAHWTYVFPDDRLNLLRIAAQALQPPVEYAPDWMKPRSPAVRVIDSLISLNRRYNGFVVPRVKHFEQAYPEVQSVQDLQSMIAEYPSHGDFLRDALHYSHADRANALSGVVNWLVPISGEGSTQEQLAKLTQWAREAEPRDYCDVGVRGFALGGFQYLRILFEACTIKPDVYVLRFVRREFGRCSPLQAIALLEQLAAGVGLCARHLDLTIWENERDRNNAGPNAPGHCARLGGAEMPQH